MIFFVGVNDPKSMGDFHFPRDTQFSWWLLQLSDDCFVIIREFLGERLILKTFFFTAF